MYEIEQRPPSGRLREDATAKQYCIVRPPPCATSTERLGYRALGGTNKNHSAPGSPRPTALRQLSHAKR